MSFGKLSSSDQSWNSESKHLCGWLGLAKHNAFSNQSIPTWNNFGMYPDNLKEKYLGKRSIGMEMCLSQTGCHIQQGTTVAWKHSLNFTILLFVLMAERQDWDYSEVCLSLHYYHLLLGSQEFEQASVRGPAFPGVCLVLLGTDVGPGAGQEVLSWLLPLWAHRWMKEGLVLKGFYIFFFLI